jgi:APA family basic amino acid/polyamine antiporter
VFRRTVPLQERPPRSFRASGYPLVPILFIAVAAAVVFSVVRADPHSASRGALLLAAGVPLFYWFNSKHRQAASPSGSRL